MQPESGFSVSTLQKPTGTWNKTTGSIPRLLFRSYQYAVAGMPRPALALAGMPKTVPGEAPLFSGEEERTLHLGIDIWGPAGTLVYARWAEWCTVLCSIITSAIMVNHHPVCPPAGNHSFIPCMAI